MSIATPQMGRFSNADEKEIRFESPMDVEAVYPDSYMRGLISFYLVGHRPIKWETAKGEMVRDSWAWSKKDFQYIGAKMWPGTENKAKYSITLDDPSHFANNPLLEARDVIPAGEKTDYLEMNFILRNGNETTVIYSFEEAQEIDVRLLCPREAVSGKAIWLGIDLQEHSADIALNMIME
ncbi:MAG: hypothetical protein Q4D52_03125 [Eubacteriales bacterium]|nr:hypothetical protein [Eubacteriales bacterium]